MFRRVALMLALVLASGIASAKPPLEAFGDVPNVRAMDLSPDGKRVAFLKREKGEDYLIIQDLATKASKGLVRASEFRARFVQFISNDTVVLIASDEKKRQGMRNRFEFSAALSFNIETGKQVRLLTLGDTPNLWNAQQGMGRILGVDSDHRRVLMPAFAGDGNGAPGYNLWDVALDTGRGQTADGGRGSTNTRDWFVDATGRAVAREDFNDKTNEYTIRGRAPGGDWKELYRKVTESPDLSVVGVTEDAKTFFVANDTDSEFMSLYEMSAASGEITGPVFQRDDAEVERTVSDLNRVVYGVVYSGMFPKYEMFDKTVQADIESVAAALKGSAVYLMSWSEDWSKLLFVSSGGKASERYYLFDRAAKKLVMVGAARPEITPADVGEVTTIEFKARDGLTIPALITWPAGLPADQRKNLPLIVMPHGGPQAYDKVEFDWLAQFLANEGYVVLQPNFRGSAGLGNSFVTAGYGEWGRKMQSDITDGADAMVRMGWADPNRMCIVGWSYGGYAALAGGAVTPEKYKCVAAIAGVSELHEMLLWEKKERGETSSSFNYWKKQIGDPDQDRVAIDAVSPALHADKFQAPVLLVHGASDKIVPIRQSELMLDALKRANKNVDFLRIDGDDHSLVDNGSRNRLLTRLSEFLGKHLGA